MLAFVLGNSCVESAQSPIRLTWADADVAHVRTAIRVRRPISRSARSIATSYSRPDPLAPHGPVTAQEPFKNRSLYHRVRPQSRLRYQPLTPNLIGNACAD